MKEKHEEQGEKFRKEFINSLIEDKLVFLCNGKDKIKEMKILLSELGITQASDIESVFTTQAQKVNQAIDKVYAHANAFFQELLKINNFSFLVGAGTSIPFGSESIRDISKLKIELSGDLKKLYENLSEIFLDNNDNKDFESFLGFLSLIKSGLLYNGKVFNFNIDHIVKIADLITEIKKKFVEEFCNPPYVDRIDKNYPKDNPFKIHQEFIRKILVRSSPLRRPNIFTLNYDLMFERSMDKMGIMYVDGFIGTAERIFKPESFNFDFYYPAAATEGKVNRLERVIHFYKLHGS